MRKGFTLAETLITMVLVGIIMALSIPMAIQSTNDTSPLFKVAYKTVDNLVNELIADTALYPSGEFSNNTFCNNFFSKINTIGYAAGNCANTYPSAVDPVSPYANDMPNAITSNSMRWYGFQSDFTTANCDTATTGIVITGTPPANTCIKISVDVNGINKGAHITTDQANKDIYNIYVTKSGNVAVETSVANPWDEEYILQN